MRRSRTARLVAVFLALAFAVAACSSRDDSSETKTTDGGGSSTTAADGSGGAVTIDTAECPNDPDEVVSGDTIKLVSSYPQSGLTAAYAEIAAGWKAYFEYTNDNGGVEIGGKKYKIETADKDDEYNAAKTAANIQSLMGADASDAFAAFSVVGTSNNLAIRDSLNDNCAPDVFAATGSPAWGNPDYPWLIGGTLTPYTLEGYAFADYLKKNKPDATVAMLVQADDFGKAYTEGFAKAIEGTDIKVVKTEKYAPGATEVSAQMTSLAATKATAFFDGASLLACPDALKKAQAANWKPITWVSGTCISKTLMGIAGDAADGALAATNIMDPVNPAFADDEAMKLYKEQVPKYQPEADIENGIVAYGWTQGALLVDAMSKAGKASRLAVMTEIRNMDGLKSGLLIPGISITTGADDPFMGETVQVGKYSSTDKYFTPIGGLESFEGKTTELTPPDLITG